MAPWRQLSLSAPRPRIPRGRLLPVLAHRQRADYWNNHYFNDTYWHNGRREQFRGYTTDVFFGEAIKWMHAQAARKMPFFCYLATAAAHAPLFVPEKFREPYRDQKPNVARFFGMIANIDENVGRLETFLAESGLRDNTIVIFMTDNGGTAGVPVFNAGMKGGKVTLWEGGHRVPCFIRWPGGRLREPCDVAELTQVQDILPTLVELCDLPTPNARFDGMSLAGLLRGEASALPEPREWNLCQDSRRYRQSAGRQRTMSHLRDRGPCVVSN